MWQEWVQSPWFGWGILPGLVFLGRILDVSIGTVRVILMSQGNRRLAPLLGFFEVVIWVVVTSQVIARLRNPFVVIAYGLGFAAGTYVGMKIEDKLSFGSVVLRITTEKSAAGLVVALSSNGFGVTVIDAKGTTGDVSQLFTVVHRKLLPKVLTIVENCCPRAFYTVEDVQYVSTGTRLGMRNSSLRRSWRGGMK
jgi:uncharacterized protein YebE (UPF0316 family)